MVTGILNLGCFTSQRNVSKLTLLYQLCCSLPGQRGIVTSATVCCLVQAVHAKVSILYRRALKHVKKNFFQEVA